MASISKNGLGPSGQVCYNLMNS